MGINLKNHKDNRIWLLLFLLIVIYISINLGIPRFKINSLFTSYVLQPLLWGLVILIVTRFHSFKISGKTKTRSTIIQLALLTGFLHIVFLVIGGFFSGFGRSPSSFAPLSIMGNLILVGTSLAGMELSRSWILNHSGKHVFMTLGLVTFGFTMISLSFSQIIGLKANVTSLSFIVSTLIPILAQNLLASLLALLAGPLASFGYLGFLQIFWWFCPILPDLTWSIKGLIGAVTPILATVIIWNYYVSKNGKKVRKQNGGGLQIGWIFTTIFSVALVWFAVGIFPVHPVMVATGSMRPVIEPGDIAIVAKSANNKIVIGDIIEYRKNQDINIVHRVIAIDETNGNRAFVTKGDANNMPDEEPVPGANIIGKVVFNVPKIGWLAAGVKSLFVSR